MSVISVIPAASYPAIGVMAMPKTFPYREVFLHGRPQHDKYSHFRIRHPRMPCSRRAKLFAPFDALRGFSERIAAEEALSGQEEDMRD